MKLDQSIVIAEGVEDEETFRFLRSMEAQDARPGAVIQGGQGFQLGYPSPEMPCRSLSLLET